MQVMDSRERKRGPACAPGFLALLPTFGSEPLVEVAPGRQIHSLGVFLFPRSVQTAVINVFKGGGLQSNELYALNENIRYVAGLAGTLLPVGLIWGRGATPHHHSWSLTLFSVFCLVLLGASVGFSESFLTVKFRGPCLSRLLLQRGPVHLSMYIAHVWVAGAQG